MSHGSTARDRHATTPFPADVCAVCGISDAAVLRRHRLGDSELTLCANDAMRAGVAPPGDRRAGDRRRGDRRVSDRRGKGERRTMRSGFYPNVAQHSADARTDDTLVDEKYPSS